MPRAGPAVAEPVSTEKELTVVQDLIEELAAQYARMHRALCVSSG